MPRVRSINKLVEHYKTIDPDTEISASYVRRLILNREIPFNKSGSKYLIDLDAFDQYLMTGYANPQAAVQKDLESEDLVTPLRPARTIRRQAV